MVKILPAANYITIVENLSITLINDHSVQFTRTNLIRKLTQEALTLSIAVTQFATCKSSYLPWKELTM